jgi:hypothetical protein
MAIAERSRPSAEASGLDDAQSAPTSQAGVHTPAEELADEFSFVIADFMQQLKILHHRAVTKRAITTGAARHGA